MATLALAVRIVAAYTVKFGAVPPDFDAHGVGALTGDDGHRFTTWYLHSDELPLGCESVRFVEHKALVSA